MELSQLLNELPIHSNEKKVQNFRNPVGISDQLLGFVYSLRPNSRIMVGSIFFRVYEEYQDCPEQIHAIANAIRRNKVFFQKQLFGNELEGKDFPEGALLYHLHRVLEIRDCKKIESTTSCKICNLDLSEVYKSGARDFLQYHLVVPLTELDSSKHYKADDFITVCPNCHAVLHRHRPWLTSDNASDILC